MSAPKGKRVYLTWTDEMDSALLAVLVEHHNNGDHAQNGWKPHVYNAAIKNVHDKCNVEITTDNITSRCKTFDKHYDMQGNKAAACYKTKVVKNWDAICTIYSTDHANGQGARTGAEDAQDSPTKMVMHPQICPQRGSELVMQLFACLEI